MRVTERDIERQCETLSKLIGKKVKMWAECGIYYCGITTEGGGVSYVLTDRDSKSVVFGQMAKMIYLLDYMGYKKLSIHYGEE